MAPPRRILKQQLELLMNFLEENKEMSKGLIPGTPVSHQETRQKWTSLAKRLNGVQGGALKTPDGWKKYWFEWRHKCRKKARRKYQTDAIGGSIKIVPFSELEVRALELSGGGIVAPIVNTSKTENDDEDSDSVPLENIKTQSTPVLVKVRQLSRTSTDENTHSDSPPPRWALDLEERRIAAEERMAEALESIATVMRIQEERRAVLDERLTEALTDIAGNVQDLNGRVQEAVDHLQKIYPVQSNCQDIKKVFI